jgi:hypothetical protein
MNKIRISKNFALFSIIFCIIIQVAFIPCRTEASNTTDNHIESSKDMDDTNLQENSVLLAYSNEKTSLNRFGELNGDTNINLTNLTFFKSNILRILGKFSLGVNAPYVYDSLKDTNLNSDDSIENTHLTSLKRNILLREIYRFSAENINPISSPEPNPTDSSSLSNHEILHDTILDKDTTINGDCSLKEGTVNLNGYTLTINGNLYLYGGTMNLRASELYIKGNVIQKSGTMFINAGKLYIDGDYLIESDMDNPSNGVLKMINFHDIVDIMRLSTKI